MPANFPNNPATNQLYSYSGATWKFTGTKWQLVTVTDGNTGTLFTYSNTAPQAPSLGDRWLNSETLRQSIYINDGDTDQWVEPVSIGLAGAAKSLNNLANVSINTDLLPAANVTHDLGSSSLRWRDLYLSGNSIILGAATLTSTGSAVNLPAGTTVGGQNVATSGDVSTGGGPKITNLQITDNSWAVLDDTAVDTAGGYVLITGTNFVSGALVYLNQTPATSVAFVSATTLRVTVPALTAGTYVVYVINPDGGTAIRVPGLTASANPAWLTASALPEQYDGVAITLNLVATEATTYTLTSGSLPPGLSLNSNTGVITGTVTGVTVDTTYTFTVRATDAQLQDSPRTFTVTIAVSDAYFKLTTLLLSGSALSANTVIRDSSTNNFNLTVFGDARASNFTPYGGAWSVFFDGNADYFTVPANAAFAYGTGAFTIEAWVYRTGLGPAIYYGSVILAQAASSNNYVLLSMSGDSNNQITFYLANSLVLTSTNLNFNQWYHIAVVRENTSTNGVKLYVNGAFNVSGTSAANLTDTTLPVSVGDYSHSNILGMNGYISNLRVVKGTAVYTGNFTPPTAPLTAIANTSLLVCHTNRFLDSSTNNFTITRNGDARVVSFNPFNITNTGVNGSIYLDGTGDYVTTPTGQAPLALDTANFTVECWVYFSSGQPQTNPCILSSSVGSSLANTILLQFGTQPSTQIALWVNNVHLTASATNNNLVFNAWNHIAVCRTGGSTYSFFINGIAVNSVASNSTSLTANDWRLGYWFSGAHALLGYIADFRIIKGTALYSSNFTPPTAPLTAVANTQLLTLQYDQPHNNHGFLDSSSNQFLITRSGNASQGTFSPFSQSGWSSYFNGSDAYLSYTQAGSTYPSQLSFLNGASATGTIECWVYPLSSSQGTNPAEAPAILAVGDTYFSLNVTTTNKARFYWYTTVVNNLDSTASVPFNAWTHIAAVRNGASVTLYINGASSGSIAYTGWNWASSANGSQLKIGYHAPYSTARYFNGYISNLRIINGTALYTANFTPATSSLTAITNTSLLVCHSNRFVDSSVSNTVFTVSGTPQVQAFSPFAPTAVYNPASHGGSAYFDGNGDFLQIPANPGFAFGTGAFTVEAWIYPTVAQGVTLLSSNYNYSTASGNWSFYFTTSGATTLYFNAGSASGGANHASSTTVTILLNTWTHMAYTRTGSTGYFWINGVQLGTGVTDSSNYAGSSGDLYVGRQNDATSQFGGYIAGLRIIKGTAVYTTNFTPPTAPVTSTTNTSLLLNFTDASILDSTGRNVIETVADAKTSSVVTKFTGGSMYFDGTGDYLIMPDVLTGQFGTGDFTVEYWDRHGSQGTNYAPQVGTLSSGTGSGSWRFGTFSNLAGVYLAYHNGTSFIDVVFGSTVYNDNIWRHFALSRQGTTVRAFVDGVQVGSNQTVSQNFNSSNRVILGAELTSPTYFTGYIADLRITKGYARYTANFTAPTAPARLK